MGDDVRAAAEERDKSFFFNYPRIPFAYTATAPEDQECKACFRLKELLEAGFSLTIAEAWFGCGLVPAWDFEKHGVNHSHHEFANFVAAYARDFHIFGTIPFLPKYLWLPCIQQASLRQDYLLLRESIFVTLLIAEEAKKLSSESSLCIRKLLYRFSKKSTIVCKSTLDSVFKLSQSITDENHGAPIPLPAPVKEEHEGMPKKRVKTEPAD